jgi:hypothetical protein
MNKMLLSLVTLGFPLGINSAFATHQFAVEITDPKIVDAIRNTIDVHPVPVGYFDDRIPPEIQAGKPVYKKENTQDSKFVSFKFDRNNVNSPFLKIQCLPNATVPHCRLDYDNFDPNFGKVTYRTYLEKKDFTLLYNNFGWVRQVDGNGFSLDGFGAKTGKENRIRFLLQYADEGNGRRSVQIGVADDFNP